MLIRDGRISEAQLQQAIDHQHRVGGRLGSIMVEMGLVDVDTLTVYLGLELGIPIATGATLERAKRSAVRLLRPEQAAQFRCVPIIVQDRQLIMAMDDPHDLVLLDELMHTTGYRILPRVAPEARIYYYLERFYGVPRPPRFKALGESARGNVKPPADLPAPPLPGLPPVTDTPVQAPRPAPALRAAVPDGQEELELEAEDLLIELEEDEADAAETAPRAATGEHTTIAPPKAAPPEETYEPIDLRTAMSQMAEASQRTEVAHSVVAYAARVFDVAALCIVRDNMAFGWKVHGEDLTAERIETLLIPLDAQSMFQTAVHDEDQMYADRPFPATVHNYLFKVLRTPAPESAMVVALSINRRVVNLLYGQRSKGSTLPEPDVLELKDVCDAAASAYVRLIASSKKRKRRKPAKPRKPKKVVELGTPEE